MIFSLVILILGLVSAVPRPPPLRVLAERLHGASVQTEYLGGAGAVRVPGLQSLPLSSAHQDHVAQVSSDNIIITMLVV